MQKPKPKAKNSAKQTPTMEYLGTYNPLTREHAEAVISTAGITLTSELLGRIEEEAASRAGTAVISAIN